MIHRGVDYESENSGNRSSIGEIDRAGATFNEVLRQVLQTLIDSGCLEKLLLPQGTRHHDRDHEPLRERRLVNYPTSTGSRLMRVA